MQRSVHQGMSAQYTALKLAPPHGPQVRSAGAVATSFCHLLSLNVPCVCSSN